MAKRKRQTRKPAPETPPADEKGGDFLGSLREGIKSAGETAGRYARMGLNMAELEALRLKLKSAYAALGESVTRCWDAAPDLGVTPGDPAIKKQICAVNELRRQIRETEIRLKGLKQQA